jgi:class 3 adenylate cyclase/AmiR/NasT family two-component response regulator
MIVDDENDFEQLIRQKFRRQIREQVYDFVFAKNGKEALEILEDNPDVEIVFSDINMPIMDGLTLLLRLNEKNPLLKAVIVSAYGDMDNIRTAMNRGAFDFICKPIQFEDLELTLLKTVKYVTQIQETVKAIKENNILRMYVDDSVLQFMTRSEYESTLLLNETVDATIVFMDICGFTAISEKESPNFVVNLINKYFDLMVKEIIAQGGYVDKFLGDAVMAVFRGDFHIDRAIEASLAVHTAIETQKVLLSEQKTYLPKVSIGINSGEMISGNIGSAALKRLDFTVIGDVVNTAQRLQSAAQPGQIVISKTIYEKIKNSFNCKVIGDISVKNKEVPITIYEVLE